MSLQIEHDGKWLGGGEPRSQAKSPLQRPKGENLLEQQAANFSYLMEQIEERGTFDFAHELEAAEAHLGLSAEERAADQKGADFVAIFQENLGRWNFSTLRNAYHSEKAEQKRSETQPQPTA